MGIEEALEPDGSDGPPLYEGSRLIEKVNPTALDTLYVKSVVFTEPPPAAGVADKVNTGASGGVTSIRKLRVVVPALFLAVSV